MHTKQGVVTSAKMTGTVTVTVHRQMFHPIYKKRFRRSTKFLADARTIAPKEGDLVEITECRPLSARKRFTVTKILKAAVQVSAMKDDSVLPA